MVKVIASSVVVLLLTSVSFGVVFDVLNQQQLAFTLAGSVTTQGPAGVGTLFQNPTISLSQNQTANSGQTAANQALGGLFSQTGVANTNGDAKITIGLAATATTAGPVYPGQDQTMEGNGKANQAQGILVTGASTLVKTDGGAANGLGINTLATGMVQNVGGTGTTGTESSSIGGSQISSVAGNPNATGTVTANMSILTLQNQTVN